MIVVRDDNNTWATIGVFCHFYAAKEQRNPSISAYEYYDDDKDKRAKKAISVAFENKSKPQTSESFDPRLTRDVWKTTYIARNITLHHAAYDLSLSLVGLWNSQNDAKDGRGSAFFEKDVNLMRYEDLSTLEQLRSRRSFFQVPRDNNTVITPEPVSRMLKQFSSRKIRSNARCQAHAMYGKVQG